MDTPKKAIPCVTGEKAQNGIECDLPTDEQPSGPLRRGMLDESSSRRRFEGKVFPRGFRNCCSPGIMVGVEQTDAALP